MSAYNANQIVELIGKTYTTDSIGQKVATETSKTVFCAVTSVTGQEFFEAGRSGINAQHRIIVDQFDYNGEEIAKYNGTRYGIYRTYQTTDGRVELYLEKKGGVTNG